MGMKKEEKGGRGGEKARWKREERKGRGKGIEKYREKGNVETQEGEKGRREGERRRRREERNVTNTKKAPVSSSFIAIKTRTNLVTERKKLHLDKSYLLELVFFILFHSFLAAQHFIRHITHDL
jgi:hypothetical protein